mmetsp:Transcript_3782/g.16038  ORF Transcript_3782/g.16038 Transcript_3782/m.16038 type:complete len:234 (+) Transcript_3782:194-895(+)
MQCPSSCGGPTMYAGFLSHSPALAHAPHFSSSSSHTPGGNGDLCPTANAPTCIHFVADHLTPFETGHPACVDFTSSFPPTSRDQNKSASPRRGFTATPRWAHSENASSSACGFSFVYGNTVSPPSSTSERYMRTVATRWPPLLSSWLNASWNASMCASYFWPFSYRKTWMPSPCSTGTWLHSAMRRSMSAMVSSAPRAMNDPSEVRIALGTLLPVSLSTTVDLRSCGAEVWMM